MSQSKKISELNAFKRPEWTPKVEDGARILIVGATGGLGRKLVEMLQTNSKCTIGCHGDSNSFDVKQADNLIPLTHHLESEEDCLSLIDAFCDKAGGIDALVCLNGRLTQADHWDDISESDWQQDIHQNLNVPFFLARGAMRKMKSQGTGGRILLNGTESALHGGSPQSFPYAVAKRGTECLVQGLAREGAGHGILVNGVRMGYIKSGFHQRWSGKNDQDLSERAELIPLKRGGEPEEAAALFIYLLSGWGGFITGQMIALTGGDWL